MYVCRDLTRDRDPLSCIYTTPHNDKRMTSEKYKRDALD